MPLLPRVHGLIRELAEKDKSGGPDMPETLVTWRRIMGEQLLDIHRRFLFAMDIGSGRRDVLGFIFYRCDAPERIYIEDMQIAWKERYNAAVLDGLVTKLQLDPRAKDAQFFGSEKLKLVPDKEILAGVGFRDTFPDGWEPLGDCKEAMGTLKVRYTRSKG